MRIIDEATVHRLLDYPRLIEAIEATFKNPPEAPTRHHHPISMDGGNPDATLLLMPAWRAGDLLGLKSVTVFPGNADRGLPAVDGVYLLLDGSTGAPLALIDGKALTLRRTAAVSALAAKRLAGSDVDTLLMVGTGAMAPHLIAAHSAVRSYKRILVWGRNSEKAEDVIIGIDWQGMPPGICFELALDLETAVRESDVISVATLSVDPLIKGAWLRPGSHVDLVGAYRPDMAEADAALMAGGRLFVDTRAGALAEAGDILQAIDAGAINADHIIADLFEIDGFAEWCRLTTDEVTIFKAVGSAVSDFAAAQLLWREFQ